MEPFGNTDKLPVIYVFPINNVVESQTKRNVPELQETPEKQTSGYPKRLPDRMELWFGTFSATKQMSPLQWSNKYDKEGRLHVRWDNNSFP